MWTIVSLTAESANSHIIFGGTPGQEIVGPTHPFGPEGSVYVIAFPGLGYIRLEDMGNSVPGGDWSVSASGSSNNWFYGGGGQAIIHVKANGEYTITGGTKDVQGKVIPWKS